MAETKNMHFVPKTYLKRFAFDKMKSGQQEKYVYALEKARMKRAPEPRNIRRICYEENLYLMPGEIEQQRQSIENMYNVIFEKDYGKTYKKLIDPEKEELTKEERYDIVSFVVSMFYRNISWTNLFNKMMDESLMKAYHLSKMNGKESFYFEKREISFVGKTLEQLQKEEKLADRPLINYVAAVKILQLTRLRMINDFVSVIKAQDGFEFLTSDNPVSYKSSDTRFIPMPFDPTNSLWMPLDSKHLLKLQPIADQLPGMTIGRMDDFPFPGMLTSMSNSFQAQQANEYLIGTMSGLRRFQDNPLGIFKNAPSLRDSKQH